MARYPLPGKRERPVHGECILMFADPKGIHRFHHWLRGLLGKLPEEVG